MTEQITVRNCAGIIIHRGDEWLLQLRDNKDGILWPGKVGLWGGAMEPEDESNFEQTARRELLEETGLDEQQVDLICYGTLEFDHHHTLEHLPVRQCVKLFVAKIDSTATFRVYEGEGIYSIPADSEPDTLDTAMLATGVEDAITKLKAYYEYEAAA